VNWKLEISNSRAKSTLLKGSVRPRVSPLSSLLLLLWCWFFGWLWVSSSWKSWFCGSVGS